MLFLRLVLCVFGYFGLSCALVYPYSNSSVSSTTPTTLNAAEACEASSGAWYDSSLSFIQSLFSAESAGEYAASISVMTNVWTQTAISYSFSTIPGFPATQYPEESVASYAIWTSITAYVTTQLATLRLYDHPTFTLPSPDCTVPTTSANFISAMGTSTAQSGQTDPTLSSLSQQAQSTQCNCTFAAEGVQLIYWPVVTVPGNPNLTVTQTGSLTGYFSGTPYVSGSVYLKYDNLYTMNDCSNFGPMISGSVVTLASDEVSSLVGDGTVFYDVESFNYANLNYPYPWTVYAAQQGCIHADECPFEVSGGYNPYISLPPQIRGLNASWSTCVIDPLQGSWDPPYALQPANGPMTPVGDPPATSVAAAGASPTSPGAKSTSAFNPLPNTVIAPWNPSAIPDSGSSSSVTIVVPTTESYLPERPIPSTVLASSSVYTIVQVSSRVTVSVTDPSDPVDPIDPGDPSSSPPGGPLAVSTVTVQSLAPSGGNRITLGDPVYTEGTASEFVIGTQTLTPGGSIIVSGTLISMDPAATNIVVIVSSASASIPVSYTVIGSLTLTPGGVITISGTPISIAPIATNSVPGKPGLTIGTSVYTENSASNFVIGSRTLTPGGIITVSGTVLSMDPAATAIEVEKSYLTLGNSIYTENSASAFVIGTQTLVPGGKITVSGTVVSMNSAATDVVVGGTSTVGLGGFIISAFGGPAVTPSSTSTAINAFEGGANPLKERRFLHVLVVVVLVVVTL